MSERKKTSGDFSWEDKNKTDSDHNAEFKLSNSDTEWDDQETNFGESASLIGSINQCGSVKHSHSNKAQLDLVTDGDHDVITSGNPHNVSKSDVGLANVTNDAQLVKADNDFPNFSDRGMAHGDDLLIVEDSQATGAKKRLKTVNLGAGIGMQLVAKATLTNTHAGVTALINNPSSGLLCVTDILVQVTSAFDAAAVLNVGDGDNRDRFISVDLTVTGLYGLNRKDLGVSLWDSVNGSPMKYLYTAADSVDSEITNSPTTGQVVVWLFGAWLGFIQKEQV